MYFKGMHACMHSYSLTFNFQLKCGTAKVSVFQLPWCVIIFIHSCEPAIAREFAILTGKFDLIRLSSATSTSRGLYRMVWLARLESVTAQPL